MDFLEAQGRPEAGVQRFARAGCHPRQIPQLRREVTDLLEAARQSS
jgi:hypothetical protein